MHSRSSIDELTGYGDRRFWDDANFDEDNANNGYANFVHYFSDALNSSAPGFLIIYETSEIL